MEEERVAFTDFFGLLLAIEEESFVRFARTDGLRSKQERSEGLLLGQIGGESCEGELGFVSRAANRRSHEGEGFKSSVSFV